MVCILKLQSFSYRSFGKDEIVGIVCCFFFFPRKINLGCRADEKAFPGLLFICYPIFLLSKDDCRSIADKAVLKEPYFKNKPTWWNAWYPSMGFPFPDWIHLNKCQSKKWKFSWEPQNQSMLMTCSNKEPLISRD